MQYPSCSPRWTALAALLLLCACPETEPFVTYSQDAGTLNAAGAGEAAHGGTGVTGSAGSAAAAGSGAEAASVSFAVTTMPLGGRYQPKNIGAIWIETRSGAFVRSLELWAKTRRRHLTRFNAAVGTSGTVDVTASATLSSHRAHHVTWDHRDRNAASCSPGLYRLCVEVTDANVTGESYCLDFDSSVGTQTLSPADAPYFKAVSLSVRP